MRVGGGCLTAMASNTERYRAARDEVFALAADETLAHSFSWPQLSGAFNWATDWFDVIARGNDRTALRIVEQDGSEQSVSFAAMAERSDRVATWLEQLGVGKGDRVVLMLGNQIELWESTLAVAKLGAVVLPATSALGRSDLADRITRGGARAVIANAADATKFDGIDGDYRRIVVGADAPGWHHYAEAANAAAGGPFAARTTVDDPMLVYFTSGTTSKPKLVAHSQRQLPRRASVDDGVDRPATGRRAFGDQLTGMGQARLELRVRAVDRRGDDRGVQLPAVRRRGAAESPPSCRGDHVLRATDAVAHAHSSRPWCQTQGAA